MNINNEGNFFNLQSSKFLETELKTLTDTIAKQQSPISLQSVCLGELSHEIEELDTQIVLVDDINDVVIAVKDGEFIRLDDVETEETPEINVFTSGLNMKDESDAIVDRILAFNDCDIYSIDDDFKMTDTILFSDEGLFFSLRNSAGQMLNCQGKSFYLTDDEGEEIE